MAEPYSDRWREGSSVSDLDRTLRRTLRQFLGDFAAFAGRKGLYAAMLVVLGALLEGFSLVLIIPLLVIVIGSGPDPGRLETAAQAVFQHVGVERPFGQLALLLGIFAALMIVRAAVVYARDVRVAELQTGFVEAQRSGIVGRLAATPWDRIVRLRHARITHLMSADVQRVGMLAHQSAQCAIAAVMLAVQWVLIFMLAPLLAIFALTILTLAASVFLPALRRTHALGGSAANANLSLLNLTAQYLGGLKLAMSQNLQSSFVSEFRQTLHDMARLQVDAVRDLTRRRLALSTLSALLAAALVLLGFGIFEVSPPRLIALLLFATRMVGPVGQIQRGLQQIALVLPVYDKVKALESELTTTPLASVVRARSVKVPDGPIVFCDVSFRHAEGGNDADTIAGVDRIDLTITPGEFVGVVGPSGAGKTTFADLLVGLFPPQQGTITSGGVALEGAALAAWRECVSYISQDPFLFHDTVRRNLIWANGQASESDIRQALTLAGADALVRNMAEGLDTVVGERGALISGGELQRIALARALLRKPRLLVLDEATGAIDIAGERAILERLRDLSPRPTIVIVAHRAETVALCDRIVRFEAGRVATS